MGADCTGWHGHGQSDLEKMVIPSVSRGSHGCAPQRGEDLWADASPSMVGHDETRCAKMVGGLPRRSHRKTLTTSALPLVAWRQVLSVVQYLTRRRTDSAVVLVGGVETRITARAEMEGRLLAWWAAEGTFCPPRSLRSSQLPVVVTFLLARRSRHLVASIPALAHSLHRKPRFDG